MRTFALILAALILGGCARYEFDVTQPPELAATHVGRDKETTFVRDPLTYHARSVEGRLILRIENTTDDAIQLNSPPSYVVDPDGESRPLPRSVNIAPHTFSKLVLPPMRTVYRTGPSWGFGLGLGVGHYRHFGHHHRYYYGPAFYDPYWPDPYWDEPRYLAVVEEGDQAYWDWSGETPVRVHLVYQRGDQSFTHDFTFVRRKAK